VTVFSAALLGIVQGLTEFLPVSSTAHLLVIGQLIGFHDPVFTVSVRLNGYEPAKGVGRTKRQAEQAAAAAVLLRENVWEDDGGI